MRFKDIDTNIRNILSRISFISSIYHFFKKRFIGYKNVNNFFKKNLAEIQSLSRSKKNSKNILLATSMGSELVAWRLESVLSLALMKKGNNVEFAIDDGILPAHQNCIYAKYEKNISSIIKKNKFKNVEDSCFKESSFILNQAGIRINKFSSGITEENLKEIDEICEQIEIDKIREYKLKNVDVGEHAIAGALRFFAKATFENEPAADAVIRAYFKSALITTFCFRNIFKKRDINIVVLHHGIYVPQGIICSVAKSMGVKVVTWNIAYRKNRFIFSHDDTYHHTLINEDISKWQNIEWSGNKEVELKNYLQGRWFGDDDWINFNQENPSVNHDSIIKKLSIDPNKPCFALLTNVLWDAQLHYPANAFKNMLEWVFETIQFFIKRTDLQLIIRVHPAENTGRIVSRQKIIDEINVKFPDLPKNIKLIPANGDFTSYEVVSISNAALIYGTKMGVELSASGIPVVVAGEAWIRGKGVTRDATSKEDYLDILNKLPFDKNLDGEDLIKAKKYAYHFFFRRMIPINSVKEVSGWPPFDINLNNMTELENIYDPGLELICKGITEESDFIYED
jgi:hypothetical protein